ncbi:MAG: nucleoside triphosphate pyrophosphohydrolase [Sphaerochaetaceae bacterium]|jgi:MazG family protein|nr:nucleoside triphosphate pyrophosphohydrolase [Sphaerochaetaceae bacterium]NLY07791.1 nucleoside triphosphate pyrophosphohydrolase [Spirochaetales bacterium]
MIEYQFEPKEDFDSAIGELFHIIQMLRSPDGCPWDQKQTPKSALQSLMGELYEYLDALEDSDKAEESEEIGDVLMNLLLIFEIHRQNGDFTPVSSINSICEKLVRRHPHVFTNDYEAADEIDVNKIWVDVKTQVEGRKVNDQSNLFSNIPSSSPNLEQAYQVQKRLEKVGFDWEDSDGLYAKILEELQEVKSAATAEDREMEIGDLLFSVVNLARFYKIHPDNALHRSTRKIKYRFTRLVAECQKLGIEMTIENIERMNEIWDEIKKSEF